MHGTTGLQINMDGSGPRSTSVLQSISSRYYIVSWQYVRDPLHPSTSLEYAYLKTYHMPMLWISKTQQLIGTMQQLRKYKSWMSLTHLSPYCQVASHLKDLSKYLTELSMTLSTTNVVR
jgi:hypothetical protein